MRFSSQSLALTEGIRARLAGLVLLGLVITATYVAQALLMAEVLSQVFAGNDWSKLITTLIVIVALIGIRFGLVWLREIAARAIVERVKSRLRVKLYRHLLDLGPGYLQTTRTGEIQPELTDKIEALDKYIGYYLPQLFVTTIGCLVIGGYLFILDWQVGLVIFIAMPVVLFAKSWWRTILGKKGMANWQAFTAVKSDFLDSMQGMTTLKAFGASQVQGQQLKAKTQRLYRATMEQMGVSMWGNGIMSLAVSGGTALAVGIGAFHLAGGGLTLPQLMIILFLSSEAFRPITELGNYWHAGYTAFSALDSINLLLATPSRIENRPVSTTSLSNQGLPGISLKNVSFAYNAGRPALKNLSFEVAPGETVALVGRSGAGKTSVVSLLLRFFDPQEGQLTIAGRDIREFDLGDLRAMLSVVAQDTYLFYGTVADNLRLGKPGATQGELEAAANAANAHAFIAGLPQGYDTIIGERGVRLSGGERQRLAIARALLKDSPILILDEATSSVDGASEAAIQEALERLMVGRTTLIIAHRLSTVVKADRIVVLENGQVVEIGQHTELVGRKQTYARLVAAQQEMS
jgi:ATP-binding cassette subfamily B protein